MAAEAKKLAKTLERTARLSQDVAQEMVTIESLAYESRVGDRTERRSKRPAGGYLTDTGDRRFKDGMKALETHALELAKASTDMLKLLRSGPGSDSTVKGTLLGDPETGAGAQQELCRLVRKRQDRVERAHMTGEHVDHRSEAQPKVPGGYR
jgi:hypothetical protein